MTQKEVVKKVEEILTPFLPAHDLSLWDAEMVKEGKNLYLRVYIDKATGIAIDDCELVSRHLSQVLDDLDPIEAPYMLEVSSPGINRLLKRASDYLAYLGHAVDITLFKPHAAINQKTIEQAVLTAYADETLSITIPAQKGTKKSPPTQAITLTLPLRDVASCRLSVIF